MFELVICDILQVDQFANWATKIVSLTDTGSWFARKGKLHDSHLIVEFDDISTMYETFVQPSTYHVETVLAFTKDLTDNDRLLIHCHAGISRSTAMAIGVLMQHGLDPLDAFKKVYEVRPQMLPNTLVLHLLDKKFNTGGRLIEIRKNTEWVKHD